MAHPPQGVGLRGRVGSFLLPGAAAARAPCGRTTCRLCHQRSRRRPPQRRSGGGCRAPLPSLAFHRQADQPGREENAYGAAARVRALRRLARWRLAHRLFRMPLHVAPVEGLRQGEGASGAEVCPRHPESFFPSASHRLPSPLAALGIRIPWKHARNILPPSPASPLCTHTHQHTPIPTPVLPPPLPRSTLW